MDEWMDGDWSINDWSATEPKMVATLDVYTNAVQSVSSPHTHV